MMPVVLDRLKGHLVLQASSPAVNAWATALSTIHFLFAARIVSSSSFHAAEELAAVSSGEPRIG